MNQKKYRIEALISRMQGGYLLSQVRGLEDANGEVRAWMQNLRHLAEALPTRTYARDLMAVRIVEVEGGRVMREEPLEIPREVWESAAFPHADLWDGQFELVGESDGLLLDDYESEVCLTEPLVGEVLTYCRNVLGRIVGPGVDQRELLLAVEEMHWRHTRAAVEGTRKGHRRKEVG